MNTHSAIRDNIQRGHILHDAIRVITRQHHHAQAETESRCALRQGGQNNFRCGAMTDFGIEVVFGLPIGIESHRLGGPCKIPLENRKNPLTMLA